MIKKGNILVTGGSGYIGSHACLQLLNHGYGVVVVDSLINSSSSSLERVQKLSNKELTFYKVDIREQKSIEDILHQHNIDAVMHFAGLKAVGESVEKSLEYYDNNVRGSIHLFQAMKNCDVRRLIFSSSATVYGLAEHSPITEDMSLSAVNPYGASKLFVERIISDMGAQDEQWRTAVLRYFNPVGAHESGEIGEDPRGVPNNLMPYITQVAMKKLSQLSIYGNDYDTPDGTGVRDYIHVMDLVNGHIAALDYLMKDEVEKNFIVNLGTGQGHSVLDLVNTFASVNNVEIPYQVVERRAGDIGCCYADTQKAYQLLGWRSAYDIVKMCEDSFRWQQNNPDGYV